MAFVKYQTVRNYVVGTLSAIAATIGAVFGIQTMNGDKPDQQNGAIVAQQDRLADRQRPSVDRERRSANHASQKGRFSTKDELPDRAAATSATRKSNSSKNRIRQTVPATAANLATYRTAVRLADSKADPSGKGKDMLGGRSAWKLNLYDDDRDGRYERAKIDYDRDGIDDEKWNFKDRRWERKGGKEIWIGKRWIGIGAFKITNLASDTERYLDAMEMIQRGTKVAESGKDILGAISPWKLNVYDDDRDGFWDRAKLDKNRDDVDDEKWNLKSGTWQKSAGTVVWVKERWLSTVSPTTSPASRYRQAFALINNGSGKSPRGKDILGAKNPWKLNVYDDDQDGAWDRAKLDTNRDDVDDEKWNFKNGRWEKDGGSMIWTGAKWQSSVVQRPPAGVNRESSRYQNAFRLLASGSRKSAKAKDLLGSGSPWKLNVYDDDRDGTWDRAKLDKNRDGKDDEKWNFKKGRWEKDGGANIWNGKDWVPANN